MLKVLMLILLMMLSGCAPSTKQWLSENVFYGPGVGHPLVGDKYHSMNHPRVKQAYSNGSSLYVDGVRYR